MKNGCFKFQFILSWFWSSIGLQICCWSCGIDSQLRKIIFQRFLLAWITEAQQWNNHWTRCHLPWVGDLLSGWGQHPEGVLETAQSWSLPITLHSFLLALQFHYKLHTWQMDGRTVTSHNTGRQMLLTCFDQSITRAWCPLKVIMLLPMLPQRRRCDSYRMLLV